MGISGLGALGFSFESMMMRMRISWIKRDKGSKWSRQMEKSLIWTGVRIMRKFLRPSVSIRTKVTEKLVEALFFIREIRMLVIFKKVQEYFSLNTLLRFCGT
jgi:hypothetical protein